MNCSFFVKVTSQAGIHARTVTLLSKAIQSKDVVVYIKYNDNIVNIKHILEVISLSITQNNTIEVIVEGNDYIECSNSLKSLITEENIGEIN